MATERKAKCPRCGTEMEMDRRSIFIADVEFLAKEYPGKTLEEAKDELEEADETTMIFICKNCDVQVCINNI